jgi:hypothetical protein
MKFINPGNTPLSTWLRHSQIWFVTATEELGNTSRVVRMRYSPTTLSRLRWDEPADYSDSYHALEALADNPPWLDGVAIRVAPPYIAIVIIGCIKVENRIPRWFRSFAKSVGGYWEKQANGKDVLGILRFTEPIKAGLWEYKGHSIYISTDGPCAISNQFIPGAARDPDNANEYALRYDLQEVRGEIVEPLGPT